jgi:S-layer homology domain
MKKLLLVLSFLLLSSSAYSLVTDIGIDPLDQSSGARPMSLGGAFVGMSDDVNSIFYNPAGLANAKGITLTAKDIKNFSFGVVYETGLGHLGVGAVFKDFNGVNINDTTKAKYEQDLTLISYGIGSDKLSVGFTVKNMLSQRISIPGQADRTSSVGYDYDAGVLWKPIDHTSIGVVLKNCSATEFKLGASDEAFPRSTRIGFAVNVLGKNSIFYDDTVDLKALLDIDSGTAGDTHTQNSYYGLEYAFNNWVVARFGANSTFLGDGNVAGTSFGLGFKFKDAEIDLASARDPMTQSQVSYVSVSYFPSRLAIFKASETVNQAENPTEKPLISPQEPLKALLKIYSPSDDYVGYDENIVISGETRPKASVTINGVQVFVGDDGQFRAVQPLNPGKNLLEIGASLDFETKTEFKKVYRKPKVIIEEEVSLDNQIAQETVSRESEISKKEEELKTQKQKGLDVSKEEKALAEEKSKHNEKKEKLLNEKKTIEERKEKVENLVTLGVIEVSPEAKFQIEAPITRGEMISWLVKASGVSVPQVTGPVFLDVPQNHRYASFIKAALDAGLIKGGTDGKFRPDDPVKEEEGQAFFKAFGIVQ